MALDNPQHENFARFVSQGKSKRDAAIAAGFSEKSASAVGSRLAKHAKVSQRIAELQSKVEQESIKAAITSDSVIDRLVGIADKAEKRGQFMAAITAMQLVGKNIGMWPAKPVEETKPVSKIEYKWVDSKPDDNGDFAPSVDAKENRVSLQ